MRVKPGPPAIGAPLPPFMAAISGVLPAFGFGRPGRFAVLRLDLARAPLDLRAVGQHQLQDFDVGRRRGAVKRRAVDRRAAAQRGRVQRADERLVHVRAEVEQHLHQTQGCQIVRMVGLQPRAVVRAHVGGGVVHVDGEEQGSVVGVGAEVEQLFGQIEPVVDDGDDGRGRAIGVGQLQIGAALRSAPWRHPRVRYERRTSAP